MDPKELNQHLFSLISMFASACWQQLGKIPSQVDGKINNRYVVNVKRQNKR